MGKRIVSLVADNYDFKKNKDYQDKWKFLNEDTCKIIAAQLTFLEFHEWIYQNIRTADVRYPNSKQSLAYDISEGFIKSDILLFGAICETALFEMLKSEYEKSKEESIDEVKKCFQHRKIRNHAFSDKKYLINTINTIPGSIGVYWYETKDKTERNIQFCDLISAGRSLEIYDDSLMRQLDVLRNNRNSIHLTLQAQRKYQNDENFLIPDREQAKNTTEELREALYIHYIIANELF